MKSLHTNVAEMLGIEYAILQAPMAGGPTTPELVAAVSNAGGLGMLGAGYMTPEQIREAVQFIRRLTERPFAVNLFVEEDYATNPQQIEQAQRLLQPFRDALGIAEAPSISRYAQSFAEQFAVVLEERVPVFSTTFGLLAPEKMQALQQAGIVRIGTATTVREAVALEQSGVELIVAQGSEAGGHRGTFLGATELSLIGTIALVPQIVDRVQVPVIAAGGIMDGRGIAAALALGAQGVQLGTAFLATAESGAHKKHQEAVLNSTDASTVLTRAFSGKYARGVKNTLIEALSEHEAQLPPYPVQNALTRDIRNASAKQNDPQYLSMWAGQAAALATRKTAGELVRDLVEQTMRVLERL